MNEDIEMSPPSKKGSGIAILTFCAIGLSLLPWIGAFWGVKLKSYVILLHFDFYGWIWLAIAICISGIALGWAIYRKRTGWIIGNIYLLVFNFFAGIACLKVIDPLLGLVNEKGGHIGIFWIIIYTLHMDVPREVFYSFVGCVLLFLHWVWAFVCALGLFIITKTFVSKTKKSGIKVAAIITAIILIFFAWLWFFLMCIFELPT